MKNTFFVILVVFFLAYTTYSQSLDSTQLAIQAIENNLEYKTGTIELESGNATLNVPEGFYFLDKKCAIYVLCDLWGNMPDTSLLGVLVPINRKVYEEKAWLMTIRFEDIGYVDDQDAEDIDYDDLLEEMKNDVKESNSERIKLSYPTAELLGWASPPYYDNKNKILHWAKLIKFSGDSNNTLNYNIRILSRKGVFVINAVASINELSEVKSNINKITSSIQLKNGHRYFDFVKDVDPVAAYTIGGLVAGKVLAKVGFFAVLAKFGKLIFLAIISFFGVAWRKIKSLFTKEDKNTQDFTKEEISNSPASNFNNLDSENSNQDKG